MNGQQQDPGKPKFYVCKVRVGSNPGDTGENTITLNDFPFVCERITHAISGTVITAQHGDYSVLFRDDKTTYMNLEANANALFGNVFQGQSLPLPMKIGFRGSSTVTFMITNIVDRTGEFPTSYTVDFVMWGREFQK
jgi:hypothetical protein